MDLRKIINNSLEESYSTLRDNKSNDIFYNSLEKASLLLIETFKSKGKVMQTQVQPTTCQALPVETQVEDSTRQ